MPFRTPTPIGFWDPLSSRVVNALDDSIDPDFFTRPATDSSAEQSSSNRQAGCYAMFDQPTFAMQLIWSLHPHIADIYRQLFFASCLQKAHHRPIRLLRLYLGQKLRPVTEELAEGFTSDLPLDIARYNRLVGALQGFGRFPTIRQLAGGMGRVLATLHWGVGVDAADIELVLGGNCQHREQPYVLDYNQCARWCATSPTELAAWRQTNEAPDSAGRDGNEVPRHAGVGSHRGCTIVESARKLARKIGHTKFYYPRSSVDQEAYKAFHETYLATVSDLVVRSEIQGSEAISSVIAAGVTAFFEEYERIDNVKQNKMLRSGQVVNVSDSFRELLRNRREL